MVTRSLGYYRGIKIIDRNQEQCLYQGVCMECWLLDMMLRGRQHTQIELFIELLCSHMPMCSTVTVSLDFSACLLCPCRARVSPILTPDPPAGRKSFYILISRFEDPFTFNSDWIFKKGNIYQETKQKNLASYICLLHYSFESSV